MKLVTPQRSRMAAILKWMEIIAFGVTLLVAFSFVTRMDSPGEPTRALVALVPGPERFVDGMREAPEANYYVGLPLPFYTERGRMFLTKEKYHLFWRDPNKIRSDWTFSPLALTLDTLFFLGATYLFRRRKSPFLSRTTKTEKQERELSTTAPDLTG